MNVLLWHLPRDSSLIERSKILHVEITAGYDTYQYQLIVYRHTLHQDAFTPMCYLNRSWFLKT